MKRTILMFVAVWSLAVSSFAAPLSDTTCCCCCEHAAAACCCGDSCACCKH